ncbi:MAG: efflux transporter outer membrane subunit [Planctomycetota bacterium]|nr:MAG: efflux transporter outer membrane subunit [Planctomycetota bacterium]
MPSMKMNDDLWISGHRSRPADGRTVHKSLLMAALAFCITLGCAVGPDYEPPETRMPDAWHQTMTKGLDEGKANIQTWWLLLNDPTLNSLIVRAGRGNLDLKVAVVRIFEARALRSIAAGELLPAVEGTGFYQRARVSENGLLAPPPKGPSPTQQLGSIALQRVTPLAGLLPPPERHSTPDQTNLHSLGFDASWEIDIFGGIRRSVESADADLQSAIEDYRDVLVSLYAEVALNYVDARALQARLAYARSNTDIQRKTLDLTRNRFEAGIAPELDVAQAESNLANTESEIPRLEVALTQTINRLGVLLGEYPSFLHDELSRAAPIPVPPPDVTVGLPAELLRQRPDVRRAERELASATAQIGVATADLYPRFSLSGTFALEGMQVKDLGKMDSRAWSFGPSFRWNIFDGVRNIYRIEAAEAITEQARLRYEQTVLDALQDVENSMVAFKMEQLRREALVRAVDATKRSVKYVQTLYETGLTDFQNVLDMQRSLFQQQDKLAESEGLVTVNLISLYKALGGGWSLAVNMSEDAELARESASTRPAEE